MALTIMFIYAAHMMPVNDLLTSKMLDDASTRIQTLDPDIMKFALNDDRKWFLKNLSLLSTQLSRLGVPRSDFSRALLNFWTQARLSEEKLGRTKFISQEFPRLLFTGETDEGGTLDISSKLGAMEIEVDGWPVGTSQCYYFDKANVTYTVVGKSGSVSKTKTAKIIANKVTPVEL
jgi:hypothetical protein